MKNIKEFKWDILRNVIDGYFNVDFKKDFCRVLEEDEEVLFEQAGIFYVYVMLDYSDYDYKILEDYRGFIVRIFTKFTVDAEFNYRLGGKFDKAFGVCEDFNWFLGIDSLREKLFKIIEETLSLSEGCVSFIQGEEEEGAGVCFSRECLGQFVN